MGNIGINFYVQWPRCNNLHSFNSRFINLFDNSLINMTKLNKYYETHCIWFIYINSRVQHYHSACSVFACFEFFSCTSSYNRGNFNYITVYFNTNWNFFISLFYFFSLLGTFWIIVGAALFFVLMCSIVISSNTEEKILSFDLCTGFLLTFITDFVDCCDNLDNFLSFFHLS